MLKSNECFDSRSDLCVLMTAMTWCRSPMLAIHLCLSFLAYHWRCILLNTTQYTETNPDFLSLILHLDNLEKRGEKMNFYYSCQWLNLLYIKFYLTSKKLHIPTKDLGTLLDTIS